ncbi:hypothetical protein J2X03_001287 [Microbacterium trichothecenolyticum]|uniref:hypothetical protein n=1 Tax=Microbacterium trichothecenolyticum TaxID=69370 RepID=UPI00285C8945|nr:hypothetical protein [Microbacterium trichothecenolyticum]MDR7111423.1 hypothetical protein [Microbacterium trichothecenolyticum]
MADDDNRRREGDRDGLLYRNREGEWESFASEPMNTGDPELDHLWDITIEELNAILDDPANPLHEKAQVVLREMVAPIVEAADAYTKPAIDGMLRSFGGPVSSEASPFPASELMQALRQMLTRLVAKDAEDESPAEAEGRADDATWYPPPQTRAEITAASTPQDVLVVAEGVANEMRRRQTEAVEKLVEYVERGEAERVAAEPERKRREQRAYVATWIAAIGGAVAAIGTIAAIIVTIVLN